MFWCGWCCACYVLVLLVYACLVDGLFTRRCHACFVVVVEDVVVMAVMIVFEVGCVVVVLGLGDHVVLGVVVLFRVFVLVSLKCL